MILACDLGGTSLRAALIDRDGKVVAADTIVAPVGQSPLGAAEIDPADWWDSFNEAIESLATAAPASFAMIEAIAITAVTRTQVFLGRQGQVLRPALLWKDIRSEKLLPGLKQLCPVDHPETQALNAFHPFARLWWLAQMEAASVKSLASVIEPKDYLNFRLTGVVASDTISMARLTAAAKPGPDGRSLFAAAGLDPRVLPNLLRPTDIVGGVTSNHAEALAKLAGIPVVAMATDTWATVVGLGAMRPGRAYNISGTTEVLGIVSDQEAYAEGLLTVGWGDGLTQLGGPGENGADTLIWLLSLLGKAQINPKGVAPALDTLMADRRNGDPVLFLPYLLGERTPYWDPSLRGALIGLNRRHRAVDLIYAAMEGVGFLNRIVLERAEAANGRRIEEMRFGGGGAVNTLWCQIKADILNRPVAVTDCEEHGLLGAAITARCALDPGLSLTDAQQALVRIARRYEPAADKRRHYDRLFALYRQAEQAVKPISHELVRWRSDHQTGASA